MEDSILTSIKKMLGIEEDYEQFDQDIIVHINSVFMILNQLGVGSKEPFFIADKKSKWKDFLADSVNFESVKTYVYLRVRLLFDPPTNSFVQTSFENQIKELEWRLNVNAENEE